MVAEYPIFKHFRFFFAISTFVVAISGSLFCMEREQDSSFGVPTAWFIQLTQKEKAEVWNTLTPEVRRLFMGLEQKRLEALRRGYQEDLGEFEENAKAEEK